MTFPSYSPQYQSTAINVGLLEVNGLSGGSVNQGMASVSGNGGGNGGGGSSNQFIGINGDWASAWVHVGLIWSVSGAGAQPGAAPSGPIGQAGEAFLPAAEQPPTPFVQSPPPVVQVRSGDPSQHGTFRFRWDRQEATARSGERAKEGRHARTRSGPSR
ncbi:hypothetical protein [Symbiobacterium terraclitae]|uniref:hypothetical protein n=1 Tax=Symbiobacterium terraclitae TaxID=557451 RepID=UPI0035B55098